MGQDITQEFASPPAEQKDSSQTHREQTPGTGTVSILSVTQLVGRIKAALTDAFAQKIQVVGELSNFKRHSSGHLYFRLKDANCALDAVMWRTTASKLKFEPQDGLEVVVEARVDCYESQGRLQLYVDRMTPKGEGALELAFKQLRSKLEAEGLFDPAHKKAIRRFPRGIALVTSPTGAAVRDIRRTLLRRWPGAKVYLASVRVQGDSAVGEICRALKALDASAERLGIDTILLARGGGSLEDLWAFNEEPVARTLYALATPVICGVGHEVDVTIADLVADRRGATPTAAAELAVPEAGQVRQDLLGLAGRMSMGMGRRLSEAKVCLKSILRSVIFRDPFWRVRSTWQKLDEMQGRMNLAIGQAVALRHKRFEPVVHRLGAQHPSLLVERARSRLQRTVARLNWALGSQAKRKSDLLGRLEGRLAGVHPRGQLKLARQQIGSIARQLESLSYRSVLKRGFSVTRLEGGQLLRSTGQVQPDVLLETELADGKITSRAQTDDHQAPPGSPGRPRRTTRTPKPSAPNQGKLF